MKAPKSESPLQPLYYATALDVTGLNAAASPALPSGFSIERIGNDGSAVEIYTWNGTTWEDGINGGPVTSTAVTGMVRFVNPSSTDITFTW